MLNKNEIAIKAKELGFIRDTLEKVYRLIEVLDFINKHPLLKDTLALKGGTAINTVIFDFPRLSVDIDLDLIVNVSYDKMLELRKQIIETLDDFMASRGYVSHARSKKTPILDSKVYGLINDVGNIDVIKVEINYGLRSHLFPVRKERIHLKGLDEELELTVLDRVDLFAAKINALLDRGVIRDLYDVYNMIEGRVFETDEYPMLRKAVLFYLVVSSKDIESSLKMSKMNEITINKVKRDLFPVLATKEYFDLEGRRAKVRSFLNELLVFESKEKEFLELYLQGIYKPELLFDDEEILNRISNHPLILWRLKVPV